MRRIDVKINNGAIADISFLLLIFFMVVTTFNSKHKLEINLPPKIENAAPANVSKKRVLNIYINEKNKLLLEDKSYNFESTLLLQEIKRITAFQSPGIIMLHIHPSSTYETYLKCISAIKSSKKQLKIELAQAYFGAPYTTLDQTLKTKIDEIVHFKISEKAFVI